MAMQLLIIVPEQVQDRNETGLMLHHVWQDGTQDDAVQQPHLPSGGLDVGHHRIPLGFVVLIHQCAKRIAAAATTV